MKGKIVKLGTSELRAMFSGFTAAQIHTSFGGKMPESENVDLATETKIEALKKATVKSFPVVIGGKNDELYVIYDASENPVQAFSYKFPKVEQTPIQHIIEFIEKN